MKGLPFPHPPMTDWTRLIRDIHDRGVLMFGDPRLVTQGYGRIFIDSLPPMPRTRELGDVQAFFAPDASPGAF